MFAVIVTGPPGAGKSTVTTEIHDALGEAGVPNARDHDLPSGVGLVLDTETLGPAEAAARIRATLPSTLS